MLQKLAAVSPLVLTGSQFPGGDPETRGADRVLASMAGIRSEMLPIVRSVLVFFFFENTKCGSKTAEFRANVGKI